MLLAGLMPAESDDMRSITIVFMGDSITFGQHVDASVRWTSLLTTRLEERFGSTLHIHSLNRGISGETTRMGLERYPEAVQQPQPAVMTLQFGLNDCNCWQTDRGHPRVSERAFEANLVEMVQRARLFGAREIVMQTNHRTLRRGLLPNGETYEWGNERYSEIIRSVAAAMQTSLCDVREVFEPFDDVERASLLLPEPDVLHLSPEGHEVYASAIYPHVESAIERVLRGAHNAHEDID